MSYRWALIASFVIVTVMILGGLATLPAGTAARTSSLSSALSHAEAAVPAVSTHGVTERAPSSSAPSNAMLSAAVASLNLGAGPAHGLAADCTVTAGGQASCGTDPALEETTGGATGHAAVPAAPSVDPDWYNVTSNLSAHSGGKVPSNWFGARAAYDPLLSEVVLFNGCADSAACPTNQTWVYDGTSWTNLTGTLHSAPSARDALMMDYDPALHGVVLFGGANITEVTLNDTWLFTGAGWSNITQTVGIPHTVGDVNVSGVAFGAMAWDPALDGLVAVDGCVDFACSDVWGQTWLLTDGAWTYEGWGPGTATNLTYLGYGSLAYDAADGYLVSYGGYDAYAGTSENYTYTMNSTGVWVNITNHDASCVASVCSTPPGRDSTDMTWDSQLDAVFMTAGYNDTAGTWLNDSWTFSGGKWFPLPQPTAPSGYCGVSEPAMPEDSNNIAPFILGGNGPCGSSYFTSAWVYEAPPQATLTATPHAIDLGTAVTYTAGWVAGTGTGLVAGWNISYGNTHYSSVRAATGQNSSTVFTEAFPYTYLASGTFTANVTWTDFFYISSAKSTVSLTVNPALVATITASATTITAGGAVTFTTNPTGGSGTYTYAWSFGDSTTSTAQGPPAHTFAKAGTYTVNLTVTDSLGVAVKRNVTITVNAKPSSGLNLGNTGTYLIIGVVVVVLAILAALLLMRRRKKPVTAQPWQAGAPPAGAGAPPSGAMGETSPGAGEPPPPPPPS